MKPTHETKSTGAKNSTTFAMADAQHASLQNLINQRFEIASGEDTTQLLNRMLAMAMDSKECKGIPLKEVRSMFEHVAMLTDFLRELERVSATITQHHAA